jgi:hypothetical protein
MVVAVAVSGVSKAVAVIRKLEVYRSTTSWNRILVLNSSVFQYVCSFHPYMRAIALAVLIQIGRSTK